MTETSATPTSETQSLHSRLLEATVKDIFGRADPAFLQQIRPRMATVALAAGEVLMRQGEPSDAIYLVMAGRLRASLTSATGDLVVLGEIGRGEPIGEMGVISGTTRGATVTALRDSVVLKLSATDFTELLQSWPNMALPLARKMIDRLSQNGKRSVLPKHIVNVCVLPLHADLDARELAARLRDTLATQLARALAPDATDSFPIALIERENADRASGAYAADAENESDSGFHSLQSWLDDQEDQHTMQVFVADREDTAWTRTCLRHADQILLVADANGPHEPTAVEQRLLVGDVPAIAATQSLWLLHPDDCRMPSNTHRWLQARPHIPMEGMSHFHTRRNISGDWGRLARILSGQATGLVLAGGGARGLSQLGIMKVLEEEGIEWDLTGGTSMGSIMACLAAMDMPMSEVIKHASSAFSSNPTSDVNWFPIMSIVRGQRLTKVVREALVAATGHSVQIEDLWKPFFCIASNYSRAQMQVLRSGDLGTSIKASISIPAALPPVLWRGDLLMDGGTFNNYPVDIMRASGAARIIGVDMIHDRYRPLQFQELPSNLELFIDRFLRPRKRRRFKGLPSLAAIVFNVAAMSSKSHQVRMRDQVDLAFTPDVSRVGMLEWRAFKKVVDIGQTHARERLAEEAGVFKPDWFESRHTRH